MGGVDARTRRRQSRGREVEAGGVDATTSRRKRDDHGSSGNCAGNRKCRAPLSQNLAATALVLAAEAAAALIADNADGGNIGVTIVGRASLTAGGGLIINSIVYLLLTL